MSMHNLSLDGEVRCLAREVDVVERVVVSKTKVYRKDAVHYCVVEAVTVASSLRHGVQSVDN